ncbi:MAG: glycosyltransferase family 39 protein [Chloroflexi bacterium]|nr:glycosyltransferase family 39 protein [Chloroflexota bacterium]
MIDRLPSIGKDFRLWLFILAGIVLIGLSILLAWVSSDFEDIQSWGLYLLTNLFAGGIMLGGWLVVKADKSFDLPNWLGWLMIGAAGLRLLAGVIWYAGLPSWGYGTEVEQAGYIMADAHARDTAAWELAQSDKPLLTAFGEYRQVDQYGGMMYLSGLVYRYLGGVQHFPIQMSVLTASFSALAILFTWAFARRLWGEKVALLAAWILALFPDAIILGSSQMREAFLMTLVAAALYGLVRYIQDKTWSGLAWLVSSLLLMLPFSPPIAGIFLVMIIIIAFSVDGWQVFRQPRFLVILAGIALVAGLGIWFAWERIAPEGINNPVALVNWWFRESARWQAYFVKRSSPLIRRIFNTTPDWIHTPILLGYGVLQPFLPGALLDQGAPIWKGIAIWRSLGWTILLPFLLVAPILLWGWKEKRRLAMGLLIAVWMGILVAALRSGGDLWDNPRYRVVFICMQVVLVAWVWSSQRDSKNPWLWRMVIGLVIILAWFVPWYLQRSGQIIWPINNVFVTLGFGLASVVIVFLWMCLRGRNRGENVRSQMDSPADKD